MRGRQSQHLAGVPLVEPVRGATAARPGTGSSAGRPRSAGRVAGAGSRSPRRPGPPSRRQPGRDVPAPAGYAGRRADRVEQVARSAGARRWSPPGPGRAAIGARSRAASRASTALSTYVVSTRAAPGPMSGSRPAPARATIRATSCGVAGPPDQVRADGDHREVVAVRGQGELFGDRLAAGVVPPGPVRVGRSRRHPDQRAAGVGDRRRRHMHQPSTPRRGRRRRPPGCRPRWSAGTPPTVRSTLTLAARWTTASCPATARAHGVRVGDVGEHLRQAQTGRTPLQDRDLVAAVGERPGGRGAEHPAGPGDQDLHGRPALAAGQQPIGPPGDPGPVDLRRVPDVDRQRGGWSAPRRRTAGGGADRRRQSAGRRARRTPVSITTTTCWVPAGPTPTTAARDDRRPATRPAARCPPG